MTIITYHRAWRAVHAPDVVAHAIKPVRGNPKSFVVKMQQTIVVAVFTSLMLMHNLEGKRS